ncbi:MAG: TlpA family protein disulfide reductase [Phycisphaerales bacterium]
MNIFRSCNRLSIGLLALAWPLGAGEVASAQPDPAVVEPGGDVDEQSESGVPFDYSEEAAASARKRFEQVVQAYRAAPALRDRCTLRTVQRFMGQEQPLEITIPVLLASDAARLELEKLTLTAVDGTLYAEWADRPDRYYAFDYEGAIAADLFNQSLPIFPLVQIPLRYADDPLTELFLFLIEPEIVGKREVVTASGASAVELRVESANPDGASVTVRIDPETNLATRFESFLRDPNMPEGDGLEVVLEMHPEILDAPPLEDLLVEIEDRREVDFIELTAPPNTLDLVGAEIEPLEFTTLDGDAVAIEDLLGHVLVLALWTIPSEGLAPVLPGLVEANDWVNENAMSVKLLAINVTDPSVEIEQHWMAAGYELPVYRDDNAAAARALQAPYFPVLVVIGADGVIHDARVGLNPGVDAFGEIKAMIESATKLGL